MLHSLQSTVAAPHQALLCSLRCYPEFFFSKIHGHEFRTILFPYILQKRGNVTVHTQWIPTFAGMMTHLGWVAASGYATGYVVEIQCSNRATFSVVHQRPQVDRACRLIDENVSPIYREFLVLIHLCVTREGWGMAGQEGPVSSELSPCFVSDFAWCGRNGTVLPWSVQD